MARNNYQSTGLTGIATPMFAGIGAVGGNLAPSLPSGSSPVVQPAVQAGTISPSAQPAIPYYNLLDKMGQGSAGNAWWENGLRAVQPQPQPQPVAYNPASIPDSTGMVPSGGAPADQVNTTMPVSPPSQSRVLTAGQMIQNPFQAFRQTASRTASRIAGLNLGDDMIAGIFQGKSPQEFFNTIIGPFMMASQLNQNRESLIAQYLNNPKWKKKATQ